MKRITLVVLAISLYVPSVAQCNMTIFPVPGHVKITSNQSLSATGTVYWICDGVDVTVTASPGSVFLLEANATITFNGTDGDEVYAKAGCVITNNTIEDIGVTINPANVTLNNNGGGSITVTQSCTNVTFDYSMVGGISGCATGISDIVLSEITIFPNPVNDKINLSKAFTGEYSIYDIAGNLIKKEAVEGVQSISVNHLAQGSYALFLNDKAFRFIK